VIPLFLRFNASEVTLSGFAGGEYFPLPASKGPAFPFLLTLDGYPPSPADCAQKQRNPSEKSQETPARNSLTIHLSRFIVEGIYLPMGETGFRFQRVIERR